MRNGICRNFNKRISIFCHVFLWSISLNRPWLTKLSVVLRDFQIHGAFRDSNNKTNKFAFQIAFFVQFYEECIGAIVGIPQFYFHKDNEEIMQENFRMFILNIRF